MESSASNTDIPRTGWTHNQPKKWSKDSQEKKEEKSPPTSTKELRTGWLHNTEAPKQDTNPNDIHKMKETIAQRLLRLEKTKQRINHRIISAPTFHACSGAKPFVVTEHKIAIPLHHHHDNTNSDISLDFHEVETIDVYFTITEKMNSDQDEEFFQSLQSIQSDIQRASEYVQYVSLKDASKMILYLQGGPGFGSPTPVVGLGLAGESSWAAQALNKEGFERVVLMDQRGTGR